MPHLNVFGGRNPAFASLWLGAVPSPVHPADIEAALKKRGSSQAAIARALNVSGNAVWLVLHGRGVSRRIAFAISERCGMPIDHLWPGRYH